jgi:hypothetical protein
LILDLVVRKVAERTRRQRLEHQHGVHGVASRARFACRLWLSPGPLELLSNLVFEDCWSCGDLVRVGGFNSIFKRDASDDFGKVVKAAWLSPVLFSALSEFEHHVQHAIA